MRIGNTSSLVKTGTGCGILGGMAIGAMVSAPAVGLFFGIFFGGCVGLIAGIVMQHEADRSSQRTRELDEIIGTTSGSLGAPRGSIPPPSYAKEEELRSWVTEWMTPPPPRVAT